MLKLEKTDQIFFPSMFFCGEAAKKTSIDGLKWRDLVVVVWVGSCGGGGGRGVTKGYT